MSHRSSEYGPGHHGPTDSGRSRDQLSRAEIRKDALQDGVTAASQAVGSVATIITGAVSDIARTVGGFATEIFEIRDSVRKAGRDHIRAVPDEPVVPPRPTGPVGLDQPKDI
jgi:hypothetical protein